MSKSLKRHLVDGNNGSRIAEFDCKFKVPVGISVEHHEIHEGDTFERHVDSANAAVATMNVAFKTSSGDKLAHMLFGFASNDEIKFEIQEGSTWTQSVGTTLDVFNNNRQDGGISTVMLNDRNQASFVASNQVLKDVTIVTTGTLIDNQFTYNAGLGASVSAATRTAAHEWVLKDDTTYVVVMTQTDGACKMTLDLHWYEHTDE